MSAVPAPLLSCLRAPVFLVPDIEKQPAIKGCVPPFPEDIAAVPR